MNDKQYRIISLSIYTAIFCLYIIHFIYCSLSALPEFTNAFVNSDMHANLRWAETILEQGPLNPQPFHPYTDWMQLIAPFSTWLKWWGNPAIYQQSPLYAYFLAIMLKITKNFLAVHFVQMIIGVLFCISIGALAKEVTKDRIVGLIASSIAGLYGPFYVYAWPLLRDVLSWLITSLFALFLIRWWRAWGEHEQPSVRLSVTLGFVLAFGLLVRETFNLFAIIAVSAGGYQAICHRRYQPFICMLLAFSLGITPLVIRNALTDAPLLSTSNRFAEAYIDFNAPSAAGIESMAPLEMRSIFERSGGGALATVIETMALYNNDYRPWIQKTAKKALSLLDPYESADNISVYYMELISPVVKYGLPHVVIIVSGIFGLILSVLRRDTRWAWVWVLLLCLLGNVIIFSPISRYRQMLCIFWIPLASYYVYFILGKVAIKRIIGLLLIPAGVALCVYVSPQRNAWRLYRVAEFMVSEEIFKARGDLEKAQQQRELFDKLTKNSK